MQDPTFEPTCPDCGSEVYPYAGGWECLGDECGRRIGDTEIVEQRKDAEFFAWLCLAHRAAILGLPQTDAEIEAELDAIESAPLSEARIAEIVMYATGKENPDD